MCKDEHVNPNPDPGLPPRYILEGLAHTTAVNVMPLSGSPGNAELGYTLYRNPATLDLDRLGNEPMAQSEQTGGITQSLAAVLALGDDVAIGIVRATDTSNQVIDCLSVLHGSNALFLSGLKPGEPVVIGRQVIESVTREQAPSVGDLHCTVIVDRKGYVSVTDEGSSTGTRVFVRATDKHNETPILPFNDTSWSLPTSTITELMQSSGQPTGSSQNARLAAVLDTSRDPYASQTDADAIDRMAISERTPLDYIAEPNATMRIGNGTGHLSLRRAADGGLFLEENDGEQSRPVIFGGSSATPTAYFMINPETGQQLDEIVHGSYVHFHVVVTFRSGDEEGVPPMFKQVFRNPPEAFDEKTLGMHLRNGSVVDIGGKLYYRIRTSTVTFGPVETVEVQQPES